MVWPSGELLAIARVATVPPAPPRFSTTTCCPSVLLMRSATSRASASLPPPAGNGTTSVTVRFGSHSAADTASSVKVVTAQATIAASRRVGLVIRILPLLMAPMASARRKLFEEFLGAHRKVLRRAEDFLDCLLHRLAVDR